ncbi:hypothetical protein ACOT81_12390 [Streptomyces sp. WI04-05B]|uniref:hypothetical protein n=1 Tax=Streptomyces TaxID=1883 RepID=UPI0029A766CD|nr:MULTISPECIES: hypothetical protein [unclassified Streptomyces]MDX2548345.1 hypothetical protein [Streptomyces sp. WI04-05B]MDX2588265.1 hypothetical protein [Streptomyces sp. WI04-05A]
MDDDNRSGGVAAQRLARGAALPEVLDIGDPMAWLSLDEGTRYWSHWLRPGLLPPLGDVDGRRGWPTALPESLLALALCHRDGRVREAALGQAAGCPAVWPLVVVRTADWVSAVRERAREVLRAVLHDADTAVRLAPMILLGARRGRGVFAVDLLDEVLRRSPRELLVPLFTDPGRNVRRFAYRLAVEERRLSPAVLARTAARDPDPVVQNFCAEAALAVVPEGEVDGGVLDALLGARGPQVRSAGVTALRRAGQAERAEEFLADRSGLVRACARYVVRQSGGDPTAWYRDRCARPDDPALPPGAVAGLAECGERADAELLWPLVGHPAPGVRARAVAGLRTLDVTDVRRLRALLDDPAPGVTREVTSALLPFARSLDTDGLAERLGDGSPRHVRLAAFRLLDAHGGLVRLRAAVALLDDPDVRLRGRAAHSVRGWYPTAEVPWGSAEVRELLDRGRHEIGESHWQGLRWKAGITG